MYVYMYMCIYIYIYNIIYIYICIRGIQSKSRDHHLHPMAVCIRHPLAKLERRLRQPPPVTSWYRLPYIP